jgi:hypothetical protein
MTLDVEKMARRFRESEKCSLPNCTGSEHLTDEALADFARTVARACARVAEGGRTDEPRWTAVEISAAIRRAIRTPRRR